MVLGDGGYRGMDYVMAHQLVKLYPPLRMSKDVSIG